MKKILLKIFVGFLVASYFMLLIMFPLKVIRFSFLIFLLYGTGEATFGLIELNKK